MRLGKSRRLTLWVFAAALGVISAPSVLFAGWRSGVDSLIPTEHVQIDGRATEWQEMPVAEVGGLSFRAMNDQSNLYLLIRGANDDGRTLLSGVYRQNVTVWFLKPDHKTKDWGINFDFTNAHTPDPLNDANGVVRARETIGLSDMGIAPEMVIPQGLEMSTSTFPADFVLQADLSSEHGRQPIFEMQIPLRMLQAHGRSVYFDVISSDVPPEVKTELMGRRPDDSTRPSDQSGSSSSSSGGGMGGHHGRHGGQGGGGHGAATIQVPKAIHLELTIGLAKMKLTKG